MGKMIEIASVLALGQRYLDAWNARDPEAVLAHLHDDITWDDPAMPNRPARGKAAVREFLEFTWRAFPDFTIEIPEGSRTLFVAQDGGEVAIPWRMRGTFLGPLDPPGFAPTRKSFAIDGMDRWATREDLLLRVTSYYDLMDVARQIGILPEKDSAPAKFFVRVQRFRARLGR